MIDGHTRVIPHLAWPSGHVQTPRVFNARAAELGINAVVVPWEVPADRLAATLAGLRGVATVPGMIVTIPHKEAVAPFCDRLEGAAAMMRVANVIRRDDDGTLVGAMYDGRGFVAGLCADGFEPEGRRCLVLGAGGAASAIAHALAEAQACEVLIANRDPARAEALADKLRVVFPGVAIAAGAADARGFDLVVNATSVGLSGDPNMPIDPASIGPSMVVADIIMKPAMTPLLHAAAARGARVHLGAHMLAAQIDLFLRFLLPGLAAAAFSHLETA